MKRRTFFILLALLFLILCEALTQDSEDSSSLSPEGFIELRPGVYVADDASALSLPTFGYDVYTIGEVHGLREVQFLFLDYLKRLHERIGLRDVVLEGNWLWEEEADDYVLGNLEEPNSGLYSRRVEILDGIREWNTVLLEGEQIRVHMVDIHLSVTATFHVLDSLHAFLMTTQEQLGDVAAHVEIPSRPQLSRWSEERLLLLIEELVAIAEDEELIEDLNRTKPVIRFYRAFRGGRPVGEELKAIAELREESIARNIEALLDELDGAPILVLYGAAHLSKCPYEGWGFPYDEISNWGRLLEREGIDLHRIFVTGIQGEARGPRGLYPVQGDPYALAFEDDLTLGTLLETVPVFDVVYVDLRVAENTSLRFLEGFSPLVGFASIVPAGELFDGIILFREVTPILYALSL